MIVLFSEVVMIIWLMGIFCTSDFFILYFLGDAPLMDMFFQKNIIFDNLKLHFLLQKIFYLCYSLKQIFLAFFKRSGRTTLKEISFFHMEKLILAGLQLVIMESRL